MPDLVDCAGKGGVPRTIAFVLPQFHRVEFNDKWHGPGFTEWTNVERGTPQFPGHYQPHTPVERGFYDMTDPDTLLWQAQLARDHGLAGFCFHHYWFDGWRMLDKPFEAVRKMSDYDFPFCLSWASDHWSRTWHPTQPDTIIAGQSFSDEDTRQHAEWLCEVFADPRYIRVDKKPLFLFYSTRVMPNADRITDLFREVAQERGIGDLFLLKCDSWTSPPADEGFDGAFNFPPQHFGNHSKQLVSRLPGFQQQWVHDYREFSNSIAARQSNSWLQYPTVFPSWDNTVRRPNGNALIFQYSGPEAYQRWLTSELERSIGQHPFGQRMVFINAWNEWAEGCHLEPDARYGRAFLRATKYALEDATATVSG